MARRRSFSYRPKSTSSVHRRPGFDVSLTGLVYTSIMMFMGVAAVHTQANLLFAVFGLMIGILLVSGVISKLVLRKMDLQRLLPDHAVVGRPTSIQYTLTNSKRFWPSLGMTVSEIDGADAFVRQPHGYMLHAAAGHTASIGSESIPIRRGEVRFGEYQLSTSFPFGFIKRAILRKQEDKLLVFPALARVDPRFLRTFKSAESTGENLQPKLGGDDEFYGLKDYRAGENPRRIYWKRTAHTGTLVMREMTQVAPPRLLLMIDTYHDPDAPRERLAAIEKSIAIAASVLDAAVDAGLAVGLVAWSEIWITVPANKGKRHRRELLALLAGLTSNTSHGQSALVERAAPIADSGTTMLLFTQGTEFGGSRGMTSRVSPFVVGCDSLQAGEIFTFETSVDFAAGIDPRQVATD